MRVKHSANADMLCAALEAVLADQSGRNIGTMDAHYVREALAFLQKPEAHIHKEDFAAAVCGVDQPGFQLLLKKVELKLPIMLSGNWRALAIAHTEFLH
jgi:hypothetical protein